CMFLYCLIFHQCKNLSGQESGLTHRYSLKLKTALILSITERSVADQVGIKKPNIITKIVLI
ncbi:MAG: hypothetical protein L0G07_08100, partial [Chryseobacterium sp.]|nr:hypothetical protein [Chryseobacterium sp.]